MQWQKWNGGKNRKYDDGFEWKLQMEEKNTELIAFRWKHDDQIPQPTQHTNTNATSVTLTAEL